MSHHSMGRCEHYSGDLVALPQGIMRINLGNVQRAYCDQCCLCHRQVSGVGDFTSKRWEREGLMGHLQLQ